MNLLIAAATTLEIMPLLDHLHSYRVDKEERSYKKDDFSIRIVITGIGCMNAAYSLGKYLSGHKPDLAIQAGIAGAFRRNVSLGDVMLVKSDMMADLGAEDKGRFTDLFDLGFLNPDDYPFLQKRLIAPSPDTSFLKKLPEANAITVNTVSGRPETIQKWTEKYHPDLESMEGAAFHYVCLMENIRFAQIRAISNYVETRNKSQWDIPLAVKKLNEILIYGLKDRSLLRQ